MRPELRIFAAWLARAIEVARRRPDALLAAALVAGVAAMVVHWR